MSLSAFFSKVYLWTFTGLLLSGVAAYWVSGNEVFMFKLHTSPFLMFGIFIIEIALVAYLASRIQTLSQGAALGLYFLYAALNGIMLSSVFIVYDLGTITNAFVITAGMFLVMSIIGFVTKKDMTGMGNFLLMGLLGVIIAMLFNWFFQSTRLDLIISMIAVVIFVLLTAYDTQKLKQMHAQVGDNKESLEKVGVVGALSLYLDFINIFLIMLRFLGRN